MVLDGPGCKFLWCEPVEARMRSLSVVVAPPCFDGFAGVGEAAEEMLIEAFISQSAVEALDKAILHGLAWLNVMPLNTALLLPVKGWRSTSAPCRCR